MGFKGIAIGGCIGSLYGPFVAVLGALAGEYFERRYRRVANERVARRSDPLEKHYRTLGAKIGDDKETVKRRYRDLVKEFHPDVLRARGAGEAEIKRATDRMSAINAAWAAIENQQRDLT